MQSIWNLINIKDHFKAKKMLRIEGKSKFLKLGNRDIIILFVPKVD
jgi:hypothetical protein